MKAVATGRGCLLKPLDQTGKQLGSKPQDLPHREPLASARVSNENITRGTAGVVGC